MNVRFFAGTKAQYLSLSTPRNPLALYFCEDTKELFWGDKLLTDGIRVVPTFKDLPARADAVADGVVYYVTETRNGYVLSPDRSEWLQTIYAPVTDAYTVPESEIYNTVTTVGAVRDIEAKIYKTIDERIANIEIGATGSGVKAIYFAGKKLDAHEDGTYHIDRLCALRALGFNVPEDLVDKELELVTKDYVDELIAKIPGSDIDLSDYVKQEDITGLATKEFVQEKIAEAELADQDVDLSNYFTKSETETAIDNAIAEIDVPDISNLATKEELLEAIEAIEHPTVNLDGYATEQWVNEQGFLREHQDLSEYAKKSDIPSVEGLASTEYVDQKISEIEHPSVDLSDYYNKSETETLVSDAINEIEIPDAELYVVDFNAPDFSKALDAYSNGKLIILINAAPDINSYAIMNYVREDLITFTKFLMSRSGTYGAFNTYYLHSDNTWELAKEVKLNKVEANTLAEDTTDLTTITIGKNTYSLDKYATAETVNQINQNLETIQNTYVSTETLEQKNYVTEQHITENYITIQEAADTYVTTNNITEVVETKVNEVVTDEIETKVTEVIEQKVESGEIKVSADAINYDTW